MIAALAALLLAAPPAAEPATAARDLARKVQAFYERTQALEASFVQTYTYAALGRTQVSRGTLLVKKPGKMRWDYSEPSKKTIAVNGSRLVQYEPEANQAFVNDRFDASAMSAAVTFLLGKGRLDREFDLALGPGGTLLLTPKEPDPRVASIALSVAVDGEVTATRVEDGTGNVNEIAFSDVKRNPHLPDSAFDVKLPKDVHLVEAPK